MISLIICSRTTSLSIELENNIKNSIGVDYELVIINNQDNRYSIFEAYNLGVNRSKYPILCFMHDDIIFHTQSWGKKALAYFDDGKTGAIGIAGSPYAAAIPGSWWGSGLVNQYILPIDEKNAQPSLTTTDNTKTANEVITLDGIWICVRRSLFDKIKFDSDSYKGFHFYDVDTCLQINQLGYKMYSITNVLLSHYSNGNMLSNWIENALIFNKKWKHSLPISCIKLSYYQQCEAEINTLNEYINILLYNGKTQKNVYWFALLQLVRFPKAYFYYKTPLYFLKYLGKILIKSNQR